MAPSPKTSWEINVETTETVRDFIFGGSNIITDFDCSLEIKRCLFIRRKAMTDLESESESCSVVSDLGTPWTVQAMEFSRWNNHNGVIAHLEPDIQECGVKWALGSITMKKASGGDGISVELLQVLKDDAVKVVQSVCLQIRKTQQWPQDWKRSVFIPMPKNVQTTTQLHSYHMQESECSKFSKLGFKST